MPIAKLVSADGPVDIYYELQGRVTTNRDDYSYSEAKDGRKTYERQSSSLSSAAGTDHELGRVKDAIDSAAAADRKADTGKQMLASRPGRTNGLETLQPQRGSIEMTDMSGKTRPYENGVSEPAAGLTEGAKHAVDQGAPGRKGGLENSKAGPEEAVTTPNGVREGEHVIEMPHEDPAHASSG